MKREAGLFLVLLGAIGCDDVTPSKGNEREHCYPDGSCNAGLVCLVDVCVREGPDILAGMDGAVGRDGFSMPDASLGPDMVLGAGGAGGSPPPDVALGTGGSSADVPFGSEVAGTGGARPTGTGGGSGGVSRSDGAADLPVATGGQGGSGPGLDAAGACPAVPAGGSVNFCNGQAQGAMTGFGWVALGAADTMTDPTCDPDRRRITRDNPCITSMNWSTADGLCLSGFIPALPTPPQPADYEKNWGMELGVNVSELDGAPLGKAHTTIALTVTGAPTAGLYAEVHRKADPSAVTYCAAMVSGTAIPFTAFNTNCRDGSGTALTAADVPGIDKIAVRLESGASAITVADLCLTRIEFGGGQSPDAGRQPDVGAPEGGAPPDPYVWLAIQDTELAACTTNGPGPDIDAVTLYDASGVLGVGMIGSAHFTPNPLGNACNNADCSGGNCTYAAISTTLTAADLVARTEGPADATVSSTTSDTGYLSLNAGTLQIQMGDVTGKPPAKALKSGDYVKVFEVDQSYVATGAAYAGCTCVPEHYTVTLQTTTGTNLPLKPVQLDTNNLTCAGLTAVSTEACGSTVFVVP